MASLAKSPGGEPTRAAISSRFYYCVIPLGFQSRPDLSAGFRLEMA
jgi:hypothetical protein